MILKNLHLKENEASLITATSDTIATTTTTSDTAVASVALTASNSEINPPKLRGRPPGKNINMDKIKQMSRKY